MDLGLDGRVAIITGATQGIGRATALALAAEGARVVLVARDVDRLTRTLAELEALGRHGGIGVSADVATAEGCERVVAETVAAFGRIDILVNNAGTSATGSFEDSSDEAWAADLDLKVMAWVRLIRLSLPHLRRSPAARIVNVANIGAKQPAAGTLPTTASRAAGLAITKALSKELAPDGILVNAVCIGFVRAGQHERTAERRGIDVEEYYRERSAAIPLGRVGETREAADVISFLVSDRASFVTGSTINIDGGASSVF